MPMQMSFRWYGEGNDKISLPDIRQIPGVSPMKSRSISTSTEKHKRNERIAGDGIVSPAILRLGCQSSWQGAKVTYS